MEDEDNLSTMDSDSSVETAPVKTAAVCRKKPKPPKMILINENAAETASNAGWYPLFLPMDRDFEAKYLEHFLSGNKKGKPTLQERVYRFLEHPAGWCGFLYHLFV